MKTYRFLTNVPDENSVVKLRDQLAVLNGIEDWNIDIKNPGKILTIKVENLTTDKVANAIFQAGFRCEEITPGWKKVVKRLFTKDCCN